MAFELVELLAMGVRHRQQSLNSAVGSARAHLAEVTKKGDAENI